MTAQVEHNIPLPGGFSLQLTGRGGLIGDRSKSEKQIPLNNLFLVGGPQTLRGFECLAPFEENYPKGSNMYWSTGAHLWAPLPFNSLFPKFGQLFRMHFFYNLGNNNRNAGESHATVGCNLSFDREIHFFQLRSAVLMEWDWR